jgi:thiol-disulfide isomerase/thioredoxin
MIGSAKTGTWAKLLVLGILVAVLLAGCSQETALTENADTGSVVLYFFWGDGCPHCAAAKPVLEELNGKFPDLNIRAYEVWYIKKNQDLYLKMAEAYKVPEEGRGVPVLYLNNRYWVGWADSVAREIEADIQACLEEGCADAGAGIMPGASAERPQPAANAPVNPQSREITLFGSTINLENQSLLLSTLLISFVDGFNPCSLWVLSMLLALTLHTGSRRKVFIIGLIFLTVTAAVYAMFIAGLFTFLSIVNFAPWIQAVVAVVALFFAVVNIKDYFWYKEGISLTISDSARPGIIQRIRRVMDASQSFWGMAGATVVLAAGVSLVEFSCTAGFPVLWTNLLSAQNVAAGTFLALLLVYMIVYQLDELVIFSTAVLTLKASRLEEKQGRILKLVGGILMLTLAVVMLANPAYMNSLTGSLVVFAVAFALVLLVLLFHRRVLPAYGIWIGTEAAGQKRTKKRVIRKAARH